jgi:hypothetical protein
VNSEKPAFKSTEAAETFVWRGLRMILNELRGTQNVTQLARQALSDR